MNVAKLSRVLIGPVVTEKTTLSGERENSVAFWVNPDSTKKEIAQAVEHFFKVTVESVRTAVQRRPFVKFGQMEGRGAKKKKAYVKLEQGQEINFEDMN